MTDEPVITVTNAEEASAFAAWLQAVPITKQRLACWTLPGLEYAGVDAQWAADNRLEGWPHE